MSSMRPATGTLAAVVGAIDAREASHRLAVTSRGTGHRRRRQETHVVPAFCWRTQLTCNHRAAGVYMLSRLANAKVLQHRQSKVWGVRVPCVSTPYGGLVRRNGTEGTHANDGPARQVGRGTASSPPSPSQGHSWVGPRNRSSGSFGSGRA